MITTIQVSQKTQQALNLIKYKLGYKNLDEVLRMLMTTCKQIKVANQHGEK